MTPRTEESPAVTETRVVHDTHRRATSLLASAVTDGRSTEGRDELRDLVVTMLRHHHVSEDRDLWPTLVDAAPSLAGPLALRRARRSGLGAAGAVAASLAAPTTGSSGNGQALHGYGLTSLRQARNSTA